MEQLYIGAQSYSARLVLLLARFSRSQQSKLPVDYPFQQLAVPPMVVIKGNWVLALFTILVKGWCFLAKLQTTGHFFASHCGLNTPEETCLTVNRYGASHILIDVLFSAHRRCKKKRLCFSLSGEYCCQVLFTILPYLFSFFLRQCIVSFKGVFIEDNPFFSRSVRNFETTHPYAIITNFFSHSLPEKKSDLTSRNVVFFKPQMD